MAAEAKRRHKERAGLESEDEHLDVLRRFSDIDSELILLDAVTRGGKRRDDYNQDRAAWKRGDIAAMWANNQRFRNVNPGAEITLLDERTVKWIPRIKAEMQPGRPTAIVVGTLHICGPNGIIALLQRNGYKFEQL